MRFAILLLLVLQPQDAPPDREKIREWLRALTHEWCGTDRGEPLVKHTNIALEELPSLIKDTKGEQRNGFLSLYSRIANWKAPTQSPSVILNMARAGDTAAAQVAMTVMDARAHAFLIDGLKRIKAGDATSTGRLERLLIDRAGWSHSREAGDHLLSMIDDPNPQRQVEIVDALGNLGHIPALEKLKGFAATSKPPLSGRSRDAIDKITFVTSPEKAALLARQVRGKRMSGEFSWYRWALAQILHLRLTDAAPALREDLDQMIAKFGKPNHPADFKAVLLHAVHDLGGATSPEERTLLTELGRLPPVGAPPEDVEPLVEAFSPGVWAPVEQRRKEAEVRRKEAEALHAPPPRIPEEKLPRIMEDRIRFVMDLDPPDPSYLAPNAPTALAEIERFLKSERARETEDKLLEAYLYLARLRDGMKTPDVILSRARAKRWRAMQIVTTIADERAESWFLEELDERDRPHVDPGRLSGPKVKEALLKCFKASDRPSPYVVTALVDLGCVEILSDLKFPKGTPLDIEKLQLMAAPDRDARLLAATKGLRMSGEFSWYLWALDQIVRLDLRQHAPELRTWYDEVKAKCPPSHDPTRLIYKMPWVLQKLGAPVTPEEVELIRKGGRGP